MVQAIEKSAKAIVSLDIPLGLTPVVTLEQFATLVAANSELRLERTANGELIIMPPTGSGTGFRNFDLNWRVGNWAMNHLDLGIPFDSSAGFTLPSGAIRSPDASWIKRMRWEALSKDERQTFAPICPDVVIELRSSTDRLPDLQDKMFEYIENGALFGLLLNPQQKVAEIYRPDCDVDVLDSPNQVDFSEVMPGFQLDLKGLM